MAAILDFLFFWHFLCMFFVGLFFTHRGHADEENCAYKPSPTILLNLSTQWHFYLLDYYSNGDLPVNLVWQAGSILTLSALGSI